MLYTETVAEPTLELLKKVEAEAAMADLNLAVGLSENYFSLSFGSVIL